ncbi:unnamed protein product [Prunus armeniaca]
MAWGFKHELRKLSQSLSILQDFFRDAVEKPQDGGKAVEDWVKKLKDIADEADDVLEEINYEFLRRRVELHNHMGKKQTLITNLREELSGKRYFLVLDDVWESEKWESLMSCLSKLNSAPGSKIIVTTRSGKVASLTETLPPLCQISLYTTPHRHQ